MILENENIKRLLIHGRVASQHDVDSKSCVFYVPNNQSKPYSFHQSLPIRAKTKVDLGPDFFDPETIITIVQAEIVGGKDVLLGVVVGEIEGVGALDDVELL